MTQYNEDQNKVIVTDSFGVDLTGALMEINPARHPITEEGTITDYLFYSTNSVILSHLIPCMDKELGETEERLFSTLLHKFTNGGGVELRLNRQLDMTLPWVDPPQSSIEASDIYACAYCIFMQFHGYGLFDISRVIQSYMDSYTTEDVFFRLIAYGGQVSIVERIVTMQLINDMSNNLQ